MVLNFCPHCGFNIALLPESTCPACGGEYGSELPERLDTDCDEQHREAT